MTPTRYKSMRFSGTNFQIARHLGFDLVEGSRVFGAQKGRKLAHFIAAVLAIQRSARSACRLDRAVVSVAKACRARATLAPLRHLPHQTQLGSRYPRSLHP